MMVIDRQSRASARSRVATALLAGAAPVAGAGLLVGAILTGSSPAAAQSAICRSLAVQLARIDVDSARRGIDYGGYRSTVLAAMARHGCGGSGPVSAYAAPVAYSDPTSRVFTLDGPNGRVTYREDAHGRVVPHWSTGPARSAPPERSERRQAPAASGAAIGGGPYRTLCVRLCDGFYFPISEGTTRGRFDADAGLCRARCPGAETRLFAHRPGEDADTAAAADDGAEAYADLPNALVYRERLVPGCGCGEVDRVALWHAEVEASGNRRRVGPSPSAVSLPLPDERPEPDEDPETLANARMDFRPVPVEPTAAMADAAARTSRTIRIVGPRFFAAQ